MAGNTSFTEFYSLIVSTVGSSTSVATTSLKASEASLEAVQNMRDSVSGVTLDEELASMMQFQRSYEASANFINTINEMIETLMFRAFS